MNKGLMILIIIALATFPFFGSVVMSQDFANAYALITANIIIPIEAQENSHLTFGKFNPGNGGSIIISPDGMVNATAGVVVYNGLSTPGRFILSGETSGAVMILIPDNPIIITNENSNSMVINGWNMDKDKNIRLLNGSQVISIGATLNVGSLNQNPKGIYMGTYHITFLYN